MKYISKILRHYILLLLCFFAIISSAQNPFIQNKGQFPKQVKAKVNLPSLTQSVIDISDFLQANIMELIISILAFIIFFIK